MKKICLILMMLGIGIYISQFDVKASEADGYPVGKNYLDLHNLIIKSDNSYYAYTKDPILLKSNLLYTIVLDFDFLGQQSDDLGNIFVGIESLPSHDIQTMIMIGDIEHERAYVEFAIDDTYIQITDLPMMATGYNAILYEGSYDDFTGFEPYLDMNEVLTYQGVLPMDYDALMDMNEIESYLHVTDPYGTPIGMTIESDGYSSSSKLPGVYQVVFMSTFNQITKRFYLEVRVFDQTAPVIHDPGRLTIPLSEKVPVESIIDTLIVTDNVDTFSSADLTILSDTYSSKTTVGSASIAVEVTDSSGNVSSLIIPIDLIDLKGPDITGPEALFIYTTDTPMTQSDILSYYTIIDDVDGTNVFVTFLSDQYHQTQVPGVYVITIKSADSQNNIKTKTVSIHVIENRGPSFSTEALILNTDTANQMSDEALIDWFSNHALSSGLSVSNVSIRFNEYANHQSEDGTYYVYLIYEEQGEMKTSRILIEVNDEEKTLNIMPYAIFGTIGVIGLAVFIIIKKKK